MLLTCDPGLLDSPGQGSWKIFQVPGFQLQPPSLMHVGETGSLVLLLETVKNQVPLVHIRRAHLELSAVSKDKIRNLHFRNPRRCRKSSGTRCYVLPESFWKLLHVSAPAPQQASALISCEGAACLRTIRAAAAGGEPQPPYLLRAEPNNATLQLHTAAARAFQAATQAELVQLGSRSSTRQHHYSRSVAAAEPERVRMRLSTASDQQRRTSSSAGKQRRQTGSTGNEQTGPSSTSKVNQENNQPEESWLTRVCE